MGLRIGGDIELRPLDAERASSWLCDLRRAAEDAETPRLLAFLGEESPDRARLTAVMELSSFLAGTMLRRPQWLETLFETDAGARIEALIAELDEPLAEDASEGAEMKRLREAKAEGSLLIALRDLFGAATPKCTTADLSRLAESAVRRAVRFLLRDLHDRGKLALPDRETPESGAGLFVLGMGKLGGGELNYSSDIDLILIFDEDAPAIADRAGSVETFSRLARRLVRMVGERTGDGYVFRTDLRLRPDPSAMPLALPLGAAMTYYESAGRDWERAAMIKARPIAGDRSAASEFMSAIAPFVWRRYLDFGAIRDIQSMKDRMDRHRGFGAIAVAGHNVKLGRGGIREIEFFAQTQQLIAGGRQPDLRTRRTDEALALLAEHGWVERAVAGELTETYWFLRRVEHALQMVADEQTHTMPEDEEGITRIGRLLGFLTSEAFSAALLDHLKRVERRFGELFAERGIGPREAAGASTAITEVLNDPEDAAALEWLRECGFQRPQDIARVIHNWGAARYRALRSEAAREHMRTVLPQLVAAFGGARDPDAALAAFDRFLAGLPSGLQFFALISSNPNLLDLLATILTSAPGLTETIGRRPHVFDALLDPAFYGERPDENALRERLDAFLSDSTSHEERLVRLRIFAAEQKFLVGVRLLSGVIDGEEGGLAFSALARIVIAALWRTVQEEFTRVHGQVAGGRVALYGLGRLGSLELTATSDVDLILFYDHDKAAESSDGERPLPVSTYYMRLTQRLIAGLSSPMQEGVLYEVDFRLRPSGNKGPLATHVDAFRRYQESEARTWERMALTRSRPVAGDEALRDEVRGVIAEVIAAAGEPGVVAQDVSDMRARIERDKPGRGPLDLKLRPGGLVDLEFIAQWAILTGEVDPSMIGRPTDEVLGELENGADLAQAMRRFSSVIQLIRLGAEGVRTVQDLPRGLADRVARAIDVEESGAIEAALDETCAMVRARFEALLPAPTPRDG